MTGLDESEFDSDSVDVDAILGKLEKNKDWYSAYLEKKSVK